MTAAGLVAPDQPDLTAARARRRSALFSVAAAAFLVALKLGTGLATGSVAFLAEAAHSATDLVAALLTLFAVRVAVRPPDQEHHYGHGKAEHLGALGESAFLLVVALAIGYESVHRLVSGGSEGVDATWWAFVVLAIVIAIDVSRMVASGRSARRYGSPALAANAVHFASDLAGSLAVLAGTILVATGRPDGDAVAGVLVAVLVIGLALRLLLAVGAGADGSHVGRRRGAHPRRARRPARAARAAPHARPPRRRAPLRRPRRRRRARQGRRPGARDGRRGRGARARRARQRRRRRPRRAGRARGRAARAGDGRRGGGARGARGPQRARRCAWAATTRCRCTSSSRAS